MKRVYKSIFPFLMMGFFLFPQVTLAIHNFSHSSDLHCNDADLHFHTQEHHCNICDFSIPLTSDFRLFYDFTGNNYYIYELISCNVLSGPVSSGHSFFSLRAPPTTA